MTSGRLPTPNGVLCKGRQTQSNLSLQSISQKLVKYFGRQHSRCTGVTKNRRPSNIGALRMKWFLTQPSTCTAINMRNSGPDPRQIRGTSTTTFSSFSPDSGAGANLLIQICPPAAECGKGWELLALVPFSPSCLAPVLGQTLCLVGTCPEAVLCSLGFCPRPPLLCSFLTFFSPPQGKPGLL